MTYAGIERAVFWAMVAAIALMTYSLLGCCAQPSRPVVDLVRPELPLMSASDLQCLSKDTLQALIRRDVLLQQYAAECEVIVEELAEWR